MSEAHEVYEGLPLLAKSLPRDADLSRPDTWPEAVLLKVHLAQIIDVAEAVCDVVGDEALGSLGLDPATWRARLRRSLRRAAWLHDLGKANSRFQAMLYGASAPSAHAAALGRQPVRHEALSAYLVLHPTFSELFEVERPAPGGGQMSLWGEAEAEEVDPVEELVAVLAVLGHHLKYCVRGSALTPGVCDPTATGAVRLLLGHPDFQACLALGGAVGSMASLERSASEILGGVPGQAGDEGLDGLVEGLYEQLIGQGFYDGQDPDSGLRTEGGRFLAVVKALLVCCDVLASAIPREGREPAEWARGVLSARATRAQLERIVEVALGAHALRPFQEQLGGSSARVTVAVAGCGSGKTLGAYHWAASRAEGRKLFFCYPTTGTATEGFGDYIFGHRVDEAEAAEALGQLVHSRAAVDLEALHSYHDEGDDADLGTLGLRGLELLSSPVVVCTADAVLGVMQNHRRGLIGSAAIASGAFVFDEVHAYDEAMWASLLAFLELFRGAPVLLMTATLPSHRREQLEALVDGLEVVHGPAELEALPRYRVAEEGRARATSRALDVARSGGRVLFVVNTVGRAREALAELRKGLKEDEPVELVLYHSRFRYEDRVARHRELIRLFGEGEGGVIAVTTQVAEMSLDLDADLLVTELAPVASLIQRMGRLNRRASPGSCQARDALIIPLDDAKALPYPVTLLHQARAWIAALEAGELSQRDLAAAFERLQESNRNEHTSPRVPVTLVHSPVEANKGRLRESGVTAPFLLATDATLARRDSGHAIRSTIPMTIPRWCDYQAWHTIGLARVIPKDLVEYDRLTGAAWIRS